MILCPSLRVGRIRKRVHQLRRKRISNKQQGRLRCLKQLLAKPLRSPPCHPGLSPDQLTHRSRQLSEPRPCSIRPRRDAKKLLTEAIATAGRPAERPSARLRQRPGLGPHLTSNSSHQRFWAETLVLSSARTTDQCLQARCNPNHVSIHRLHQYMDPVKACILARHLSRTRLLHSNSISRLDRICTTDKTCDPDHSSSVTLMPGCLPLQTRNRSVPSAICSPVCTITS